MIALMVSRRPTRRVSWAGRFVGGAVAAGREGFELGLSAETIVATKR